jgi:hypothetical protein
MESPASTADEPKEPEEPEEPRPEPKPKRGPGRPRKVTVEESRRLPPKPPPRRTQSEPVHYEEDSMAALARLLAKHKEGQVVARKEHLRNLLRL